MGALSRRCSPDGLQEAWKGMEQERFVFACLLRRNERENNPGGRRFGNQQASYDPNVVGKPLPAILPGTLHPFLASLGLFESEAPKEGRNAHCWNSSAVVLLRCCRIDKSREGPFLSS